LRGSWFWVVVLAEETGTNFRGDTQSPLEEKEERWVSGQ